MRAQALDRALPAIAGFIAERTGIRIVRSNRAATDGKAIYLPSRRCELDLSERDLVESVAFLYHECGHMRHSDFSLAADNPLKRAITGTLEDIRIEKQVMGEFPAARRYLGRLMGYMVEDGAQGSGPGFTPVIGNEDEPTILQKYMLYRLRRDVLRQQEVDGVCGTAISAAQTRFPAGMMTRLDALMFEVEACESEADVFSLADEIVQMIKDEKEKEEQKEREQQEDAGEQQDQQPQSPDDGGGQQGGGGQQQDGDQGNNQQQHPGDQDGADQTAPGQSVSPNGDGSGNDGAQQGAPSQGQAGGAGGAGASSLDQLLGMTDEQVQEDLGAMLVNALNAAAQADASADGVCLATPNVYQPKLRDAGVDMGALRASINATRTRTLQWMSSIAEGDVSHSRAGMQLDPSRIWSARLGASVFVREDEGIDLNGAVSVLIDRSGSMKSAIRQAAQAGVATMLAFDVPGLKTQVSVFPWGGDVGEGVAVIKRWNESPRSMAGRVASLTADGGTPMAEAITFAACDVARREETLKVVLVVTDGEPNNMASTRYVIDRARASGVIVLGLGIGVDTAPVFGAKYAAAISNIGELSVSMVRLVKAAFEDSRRQ